MLEVVGVEPGEEQVYLALTASPAVDAEELSERTGLSHPEVRRALAGLEGKGLLDVPAGPLRQGGGFRSRERRTPLVRCAGRV